MLSLVLRIRNYNFREEMKAVAGNLYITTDDGSYGNAGMVTDGRRPCCRRKTL